jgi:hypothetical protein
MSTLFKKVGKSFKIKGKKPSLKSIKADSERSAKPVGKRVSKNGKVYYESRVNRSDVSKKFKF